MSYQKVLAECQCLNAQLNQLPYQLGTLRKSDAKQAAKLIVGLKGMRKDILTALNDLSLSDGQIQQLTKYLAVFNAKLRTLEA